MSRESIRNRFPPPWIVDETPGGFRVVTNGGILLAYVYARDDLAHHTGRQYLTTAEARSVALAIAALGSKGEHSVIVEMLVDDL